ncbi:hypothetical protein [Neobacillus vireti]|uniref:Uncharacterized protein n=1 Tax=Neobacillus vireti LMG 21834 TaxID=1131730 RepID=A0AB94IMT1_9BACI|nr:hypothetical protein [Neobacillus vireti]ETI68263.1 hypothetical protein BAVI_13414 [Neobacillus vireti LMG 21834]KLT17722.1 hypothetical protein AA980_11465 [Neobacillus vireti]
MVALYFMLYWHFWVMVILVLLLSGLICALFPRLNFLIILLASGFIGYLYPLIIEVEDLTLFTVVTNIVFSLIGIGYVKFFFFLKKKAEEYQDSEI